MVILLFLLSATVFGDEMTISVDPPAASKALARYFAAAMQSDPWSAPNSVLMEIDAYLPRLSKEGHVRAIRFWPRQTTPDYQVLDSAGDAMVRQQVIA